MGGTSKTKNGAHLPEFPTPQFKSSFLFICSLFQWIISGAILVAMTYTFAYSVRYYNIMKELFIEIYDQHILDVISTKNAIIGILILIIVYSILKWFYKRMDTKETYLINFSVYKPPKILSSVNEDIIHELEISFRENEDALEFQKRIMERSGLGNSSYFPPALHYRVSEASSSSIRNIESSRDEAEMVMFACISDLLKKTKVKARDIDILIVNCSLFNPTPSLSAMIINNFKMRSDIESYNLSGMGCSAGLISIKLAQDLLKTYANKYALVMSMESITQNWYFGSDRSMLIPNVLFRMGGSAILLSNKAKEKSRAKYLLNHLVRVNLGADDTAYTCVFQHTDKEGLLGVELTKDLVHVASKALTKNMTRLGPLVLPLSEKIFFVINYLYTKMGKKIKKYTPDFKRAFDHFCIHAGGRAVIEGMKDQLGLSDEKASPSKETLFYYGNTSSSSIWYSLAYVESFQNVKKGDVIWQISFGSGFKCNSGVWKARKNINEMHSAWRDIRPQCFNHKSTMN